MLEEVADDVAGAEDIWLEDNDGVLEDVELLGLVAGELESDEAGVAEDAEVAAAAEVEGLDVEVGLVFDGDAAVSVLELLLVVAADDARVAVGESVSNDGVEARLESEGKPAMVCRLGSD